MKKDEKHGDSGFTLVEILLVIVLIAILAAISLKYYKPFMNRQYCMDVETKVHETMLKAVKELAETGTPATNAAQLGIDTGDVIISIGYSDSRYTVNGTDATGKCPRGTKYILNEDKTKGTWK